MQNTTTQWRRNDTVLRKIYTSHFIWKVRKGCVCERELETEQNCNRLTPTLMTISVESFLFSRVAQPEAPGPTLLSWVRALSTAFCHRRVSKLTDFLSSPSYITIPSPPQSLEWHVWSSSSGNNCHAVHRSLSSGASVYECTLGFYHVPFCQPMSPTPMEYALPPSLEWHIWPGRRSIYNKMRKKWLILVFPKWRANSLVWIWTWLNESFFSVNNRCTNKQQHPLEYVNGISKWDHWIKI